MIPIGSTLSFRDLERSLSLTSWIVSFSNFLMRKTRASCCSWGWILFLKAYRGSLGTLVFSLWENSPSKILSENLRWLHSSLYFWSCVGAEFLLFMFPSP